MSIGANAVHVLYVGRQPESVTALPDQDEIDRTFLATVVTDTEVAVTQLMRAEIDCVVCEAQFLESDAWTFLHRIADRIPDVPVVVQTDADTDIPAELYDATAGTDDAVTLASVLEDLVVEPEPETTAGRSAATLLEAVTEYVAHVDRDGTVRMVNATAAERLDVTQEEIVGRNLRTLVDEESAADLLETGRAVLESGEGREFRDETDGRHYHTVFEPVDEDRFEVVVRDVTAIKRAERAFKEERAFLEAVIDSLTEVFFVLDTEFRLVRWNDRVNEVTGWTDERLRGTKPMRFLATEVTDVDRERLGAMLTEENTAIELPVRNADGEVVPFEFTGSLVRDEDDTLRYVCGLGRDISARRATEAELDAAIEELERSNAELEQFAYVASHDLKEPLRMVSSYLQLLERRYGDDLDEDATEFIEFAVDGARRMQEMIDDLLEYSRIGRRDGEFEPVDLNGVLQVVQHTLQVAIEERDATVEVGDLPTVHGERSRLTELFQNLVSNAIRYSEGPPRVEVTATREDEGWVVAVADEGVGIPDERIDRIFDLFYRSDVHDSTGIGLALAKKIAESHGGEIRVESTPGEGSTFFVSLPSGDPDGGDDPHGLGA